MDQIADYGAGRMSKLDDLAKSIGLAGKSGTTGADVAGMIARGENDRVREYVLEDVAQAAMMLVRFRAVQGWIVPSELAAIEMKLAGQFQAEGITKPFAVPIVDHTIAPNPAKVAQYEQALRAGGLARDTEIAHAIAKEAAAEIISAVTEDDFG
jgi:hypothetical protein